MRNAVNSVFKFSNYFTQDYAMLVLNNITRLQQQQQQQLEQQKKLSVAKAFDPNNNNGWFDGNRNDVLKNGNDVVLKGNPE